jgi:hypothetical protein
MKVMAPKTLGKVLWQRRKEVLSTNGRYYKHVMVIIYDRNDWGLYYKTRILMFLVKAKYHLAIARCINYVSLCCKLKRAFMIVNYNYRTLIIEATGQKCRR